MLQDALKLNPGSAIAMIEYANGLVMLEGDKRMKEATQLYEDAAACEPLDAMERLDVEMAKAELEDRSDPAMKFATLLLVVALSLCGARAPAFFLLHLVDSSCLCRRRSPRRTRRVGAADAGAADEPRPPRRWPSSGDGWHRWFKGTPVVVAQRQDGAVIVDVPREF